MTVKKKTAKPASEGPKKAAVSKAAAKPAAKATAKTAVVKAAAPKAAAPVVETPKPAAPVKPAAPAAPKPVAGSSTKQASSSIESVKQQLMMQRATAAKKPAVTETRKPMASPQTSATVHAPKQTTATHFPASPAAPAAKPGAAPISKPAAAPEIKKTEIPAVKPYVREERKAEAPAAPPPAEVRAPKKLSISGPIVVKDLADMMGARVSDLIQKLIKLGVFASINQAIGVDVAKKVVVDFGYEVDATKAVEEQGSTGKKAAKDDARRISRAPIVTFMGHVDHGKTSLLDAIRNTKVAAKEAGGITQHIGAYEVFLPKGSVTFLDTPGHEAFTAMRARGARVTDVVVLVVAADDGVMPQTIEAIDHAKAAGVTIIVAINKIDLPSANPDRVKKGLAEHNLLSEDWGGKTITMPVSAKTGKGIDELLEMLILESDLLELKADPTAPAKGVVIEAELSKESGVLATVLVQDGTLHVGDFVVIGPYYCKVRAMINDRGQRIKEAHPSMPVAILGLDGVPKAGDEFVVVDDEKTARDMAEKKGLTLKTKAIQSHMTLEDLSAGVKAGKVQELKLIIKSDVQGSVEALRSTLDKIPARNVRLNIIHTGIGDISESDVMLAAASDAVVIGFHVDLVASAREIVDREQVDVRFYQIIYEVKTALEKAMEGMLEPEVKESFVGTAEVRQVFKVSKVGTIAGCQVIKGKIVRNLPCRVVRAGVRVAEGKVESLKRFKDDAREVLEGFECGIGVSNFDELVAGDRIEVYEILKKARKLE